jgi:hypothetical protein
MTDNLMNPNNALGLMQTQNNIAIAFSSNGHLAKNHSSRLAGRMSDPESRNELSHSSGSNTIKYRGQTLFYPSWDELSVAHMPRSDKSVVYEPVHSFGTPKRKHRKRKVVPVSNKPVLIRSSQRIDDIASWLGYRFKYHVFGKHFAVCSDDLSFVDSFSKNSRYRVCSNEEKIHYFTKNPMITKNHELDYIISQSHYDADEESEQSDGCKEDIALRRLKKLNLTRRPANPHACIDYLQRNGLIAQFRIVCESPSAREYFLKCKVEKNWRTEIRRCIHHRIDVSMDKLVKQSGLSHGLSFIAGCSVTAAAVSAFMLRKEVKRRTAEVVAGVEKISDEATVLGKKTGILLMRFLITVVQVYHSFESTTPAPKLTAIIQMTLLAGEMYITDWMTPLIEELKKMASHLTLQAGEITRSPLLKALMEILSKVVSSSFFPKVPEMARLAFSSAFKTFTDALEGVDLFTSLSNALKVIVNNIQNFVKSGDLADLFGRDVESQYLAEMDAIESIILAPQRSDLVATESPKILQYRARIEEIRVAQLGDRSLQNPIFTSKLAVVRELIFMFLRNSKATRREPLGIIFAGDSGTGKTTFTETMCDMVRARHDIPNSMGVCWTYQPSKHQTIPSVVLVVQINDAFQMKDEIEPMLPLLQSLVDKTIVKAEGASLREKEMSAVEPEVVVVSTNAEKYVFTTVCGDVDKLVRRYYLIRMVWSDKARDLASKGKYEISKTWSQPSNVGADDLVEYWFGEAHTDRNTIFFDSASMKRSTKFSSLEGISRHVYKLYTDKMSAICAPLVADKCKHGVTSKAKCDIHPCDRDAPSSMYPLNYTAQLGGDDDDATIEVEEEKEDDPPVNLRMHYEDDYEALEYDNLYDLDPPEYNPWRPQHGNLYYLMPDEYPEVGFSRIPTVLGHTPTPTFGFAKSSRPMYRNCLAAVVPGGPIVPNPANLPEGRVDWGVPCGVPVGTYQVALRKSDYRMLLLNDTTRKGKLLPMGTPEEAYAFFHTTRMIRKIPYGDDFTIFPDLVFDVSENYVVKVKTECANIWSVETMAPLFIVALSTFLTGYLMAQFCIGAYRWVYGTNQACLGGAIADVPNVHNDAEVMIRKSVPWLGSASSEKTLVSGLGKIKINAGHLNFAVYVPGVIMFPKHLVENAKENDIMHLIFTDGFECKEKYSEDKIYLTPTDLCFYYVGNIPGCYAGVRELMTAEPNNPLEVTFRGETRKVLPSYSTGDIMAVEGVTTVAGDCGELYFSGNVIVGMHVGFLGIRKCQMAVRLYAAIGDHAIKAFKSRGFLITPQCKEIPELITNLIKTTDQEMGRSDMYFLDQGASHQSAVLSGMVPIGCKKGMDTMNGTCHKSSHYEAFAEFDPKCGAPNMGHAKMIGDKYVSAITKRYHTVSERGVYNHALMRKVVTWYSGLFGIGKNGLSKPLKPLTLYTALVGHPLNALIGAKALEKAVGFDLKQKGVTKKNAFTFNVATQVWVPHPAVLQEVNDWKEAIDNDIYKPMIVEANVKDECLLETQLVEGKARLFYVPPMAFNILMKQYFAPLVAHLYSRPELSGMFCAINPVSGDWDRLVGFLTQYGGVIFEGDQKSFDNLHSWIFVAIILFIKMLCKNVGYTEVDTEFTMKLVARCREYILVMSGGFYVCNDKMFSGKWITLFFNCLATIILTRMANAMASGRFSPNEVAVGTVGDDLVMGTSRREADLIDPEKFRRAMKEMGYTFTPSSKNEQELRYRTIGEASFLKRDFTYEEGRWKGRLAQTSLFKTLCYSLSTKDDAGRDRSAYNSVLHEAVLWGEEFYAKIYAKGVELNYAPPTYEKLHAKFLSGNYRTWDLENPVDQRDAHYHDFPDGEIPKDVYDDTFKNLYIDNEGLEMVLQSGFNPTPTERTLDMSSEARLETASKSQVTTLSAIDKLADVSSSPAQDLVESPETAPLAGFWARNRRIASYAVSSSTVLNVSLDIQSSLMSMTPFNEIMGHYYGYSGDYRVTCVYTGSTSSCGMVRISATAPAVADSYSPVVVAQYGGIALADFTITSTKPHMDLNLSEAGVKTMILPFPYASSWDSITNPSWLLQITELLPLANVNGLTPNDVTLEIWVSMENVKLYNLYPQSGNGDWPPKSKNPGKKKAAIVKPKERGWVSDPKEPSTVMVTRKNVNTASSTCSDLAYHIAQEDNVQTNVAWNQFPLGREDDSDLVALRRRWGQLRLNWPVGIANQVECYPGLCNYSSPDFYLTPLAFFSAPFKYWTGSLDYKLEIFTSPLVRWRIGIVVLSPYVAIAPPTFPTFGDYVTHEVEISGSTTYEFTVPYANLNPFTAFQIATGSAHTCPAIAYYSLMTPTGPSASVPFPYINLFVRAGKDYECAVPCTSEMAKYTPQSGDSSSAVTAIFGAKPITDLHELMRIKMPVLLMGAVFTAPAGVRQNFSIPADGMQMYIKLTTLGVSIPPINIDAGGPSFRNWLGKAFIGYNGGSSMTISTFNADGNPSDGICSVGFDQPGYGEANTGGLFGQAWNYPGCVVQSGIKDISVPSISYGRFKTGRGLNSNLNYQVCVNYRCINEGITPTQALHVVSYGGSDDLVVGGFLGIPKMFAF